MPTIYIDMDGVVADWEALARQVLGTDTLSPEGRWPDHDWARLKAVEHFYRILPKMPMADEMMNLARRFRDHLGWDLYMLTALPHNDDVPDCAQDKIEWMEEYYPDVKVKFGPYSQDKQKHCNPGDILVDDRTSNIQEWRAAGGHAIHVTNDYKLALDQLDLVYRKLY
jgi:5'(3')-deoxyribonucleotidase